MRRIDRIFGALVDTTPKTICNDKNGENSDPKLFASKACYDKNEKNDENRHKREKCFAVHVGDSHDMTDKGHDKDGSKKGSLDMQAEKVLERKQDQITSENVTKHSKQPVLELLTSNIEINDMMLIDSPLAPLYSPLTPLINRMDDEHRDQSTESSRKENSSPLRPMSPDTLNLLTTFREALNEDLDKSYEEEDSFTGVKKVDSQPNNELNRSKNAQVMVTDFSSDTDSDYVPDSNEDSDSEKQKTPCFRPVQAIINNVIEHSTQETENEEINYNNENVESISGNLAMEANDTISTLREGESQLVTANTLVDTSYTKRQIVSDDEIEPYEDVEAINEQPNTPGSTSGRPKRGRKRKYHEHTLAQWKQRKYSNLPYNSKTKFVAPRKFVDYDCKCIKVCPHKVSKQKRLKEFEKFVTLGSYEAQLLYIVSCVTETPKTRAYTKVKGNKTGKKRPKTFSRKYTICDIEVCRNMFIKTFQVSPKKIYVALRKTRNGTLKDLRGQSRGGWNKTSDQDMEIVRNTIEYIPKYESHYRREQVNGVKYLKPGTTLQVMYDLYLEKLKLAFGEDKKPVSLSTLKSTIHENYNLRLKSLKKDTCNRCDKLTNKIKNTAVTEELEKLMEEKDKHLKRAEDQRCRMNEELKKAKTDETFECLTFDLEKTLPLPRIPTNIVFYKRQLWLYNCGVHAGSNDCGHCYTWVEGEARRGAQEVSSCLIHFIRNKLDPKVEHLSLWSDCCGGQNRNIKIVLMLKGILHYHATLKTIVLNYLESGHTFLPNDTDFSKIETQLKHHERIYTADEYIKIMKNCKKKNPLQVYKMKKEDFLSSKNLEKKIVNRKTFVNKEKTNWLITKGILLKKDDEAIVFMKTIINDEFQELNIEKKVKGRPLAISETDFSLLWPNGKEIPQAKLDDLRSMFDLIPRDCLPFYYSLRGNSTFEEDIEGYAGPVDFETTEDPEEECIVPNIDTD